MSLAEIIFFGLLVAVVYFVLTPLRTRLERWLLSLMGKESGTPGQGQVFRMKRKD